MIAPDKHLQTDHGPITAVTPRLMGFIIGSVLSLSVVYYGIGRCITRSPLNYLDYLVLTSVLALVITGGYQVFFWAQRNNYYLPTRCLHCRFDDYIPFRPSWVWPYSVVYMMMLGAVLGTIRSLQEGLYVMFSGILLLAVHSGFAMLFPCTVPKRYRQYTIEGPSTQLLYLIQRFDNKHSAFPSMHCSLGTFVGLLLYSRMPLPSAVFIALTPVACLLVKQHQIGDTVGGILLGGAMYCVVHATLGV
jgi:hypothetical protein